MCGFMYIYVYTFTHIYVYVHVGGLSPLFAATTHSRDATSSYLPHADEQELASRALPNRTGSRERVVVLIGSCIDKQQP